MIRPSWVVLAPCSPKALARLLAAHREEHPWQSAEGTKGYLSIFDMEPGAACSGEDELASTLSRSVKQPKVRETAAHLACCHGPSDLEAGLEHFVQALEAAKARESTQNVRDALTKSIRRLRENFDE